MPEFVARKSEIFQIHRFLNQSIAGHGTVCFIAGEAGAGKTALISEFARRAQDKYKDLVVAVGQCDAQTGVGDPYLPFREMLGQLTGDVEKSLAQGITNPENADRIRKLLVLSGQALIDVGPDLIGIFIPLAGLITRLGTFAAEHAGLLDKLEKLAESPHGEKGLEGSNLEQSHIFEQYTNVLSVLAEKQPLLLVLDDLQWADAASIGLLFRLGRRIGKSRILIIGTYRPEEIAFGRDSGRHPLEKVLVEFKRYYGDIFVDLDQANIHEGRLFVDAFLDTEPNSLDDEFHNELFHCTSGHPLFTIELLRYLQEKGCLIKNRDGEWIVGSMLSWEDLPAQVEGVIEERIFRLDKELRQLLRVGSVEGESFTAEVVANIQETESRKLIRRLRRDIEKRHRLVIASGTRRLESSGQCLSFYKFQHNLFQKFLYNEMDEAEQVYLHEDIGLALEELYGDQVDEIVVRLAQHFYKAGLHDKAHYYLIRAGDKSMAIYANDEALAYYNRALELTPENALKDRFDLLKAREQILDIKGDRDAQKQDLITLRALADAVDDDRLRSEIAIRQSRFYRFTSNYPNAISAAKQAVHLAQSAHDLPKEAKGYMEWGQALSRQSEYQESQNRLTESLSISRDLGLTEIEGECLLNLGNNRYLQGDFEKADEYYKQSLHIFRQQGNRLSEWSSLNNLGNSSSDQGNRSIAKAYYEQSLKIAREIGDQWRLTASLNNLGLFFNEDGFYIVAKAHFEQALEIKSEIDDLNGMALALYNLAETSAWLGDYESSESYSLQSIQIFREIGDKHGEGQILYFRSLLHHLMDDNEAALEYGLQAHDIAQELNDKSSQGFALIYTGHALAGLGHLEDAADVYQQSLHIRRDIGQPHLAIESLAGLTDISFMQGDLVPALALVEEILDFLEHNTLNGTSEPIRIYLVCYRVLTAIHDPRALEILTRASKILQERATRIDDQEIQKSFLQNVSANRGILAAYTN